MTRPIVRAAGGVLWRGDRVDPEVALVHRPRYEDWSLPKGKAKAGEHLLVTAMREVTEETGFAAQLGPYLTDVRYRVSSGDRTADKVVKYWSMHCSGGTFAANKEVDALVWLSVVEAQALADTASDRLVLQAFAGSEFNTEPMLLVRNGATAVPAHGSSSGEPPKLNRSGRQQASALVPVLEELRAAQLLSADVPACVDLLAPFAANNGLTVRRESALTRTGFAGHELEVAERVRHDAALGGTLVVCGPQPVISGLLGALSDHAAVHPPHETTLRKGGWWLLHHRDGRIHAFERHEPAA